MTRSYSPRVYTCVEGHILYTDNVWVDNRGNVKCRACEAIQREDPVYRERLRERQRMAMRRARAKEREERAS